MCTAFPSILHSVYTSTHTPGSVASEVHNNIMVAIITMSILPTSSVLRHRRSHPNLLRRPFSSKPFPFTLVLIQFAWPRCASCSSARPKFHFRFVCAAAVPVIRHLCIVFVTRSPSTGPASAKWLGMGRASSATVGGCRWMFC